MNTVRQLAEQRDSDRLNDGNIKLKGNMAFLDLRHRKTMDHTADTVLEVSVFVKYIYLK